MNILIVGGGLVGSTLAGKLAHDGHDVTLVERSDAKVRDLTEHLDVQVVEGNGAAAGVLRRAGVESADVLVATTDADETNMVVGLLATSLFHVERVIVRLRDPALAEGFSLISRDHPTEYVRVDPETAAVERILALLEVPGAADMVPFLGGRLLLVGFQIQEGSDLAGLMLSHIQLMFPATALLVAAIQRDGDWIIPHGEEEIRAGDLTYFAIPREELPNVLALIGASKEGRRYVMIAGASRIGLEVARRLEKTETKVVLVEEIKDLAAKAQEALGRTLVVCGQVTERELLEEENIERVSTFIGATTDHEVNLVSSLLAKRLGARRAFALVDNPALANLVGEVGLDAMISPRLLAVGLALQHIRRGRIRSVAALLEDKIEVIEAEALPDTRLTSGTLAEVGLPRGVLVAALRRGDKLLLVRGPDRVLPGDQVLIITTTEKAARLDEYLSSA